MPGTLSGDGAWEGMVAGRPSSVPVRPDVSDASDWFRPAASTVGEESESECLPLPSDLSSLPPSMSPMASPAPDASSLSMPPTMSARPDVAPPTPDRPAVAEATISAVTWAAVLTAPGPTLPPRSCISPVTLVPMKLTAGMTRRGLKQHMNNVAKPMRVGKNDEETFVSLFATLSSALPTMRINADNGLTSITPATASTHFKAAGRVVLQPDIMIGSGATAARRTRLSNLAASMPDNARDANHTRT